MCQLVAKLVWRRLHPKQAGGAGDGGPAREDMETVLAEEFGALSFDDLLAQEKADATDEGVHHTLPVKHNLFYGEKY